MPKMSKKARDAAERLKTAFEESHGEYKSDLRDAVTDMLTDLRHYCDYMCFDFAEQDRIAYRHYTVEKDPKYREH